MKILYNEGNPFGLKLLLCAKFGQKDVSLAKVALNDSDVLEPVHLPKLQLPTGTELFSSNAAAKYLFNDKCDKKTAKLRDEWLEWSATRLAPALTHNMAVGHRADPNAKFILNSLVRKLDEALQSSPYLTGNKISVADLAVWSLLAPDGTLKGSHDIDHLIKWYRGIAELPQVKSALAELPLKDLHFASLQKSNRFGGLHHIHLIPNLGDEESSVLADAPSAVQESVSAEELQNAQSQFVYADLPAIKNQKTILPQANKKNVLVTSALPYVNNVPHLGNIIGCVLSADIFARYSRLCGNNTLYVCGTDEYGTATETKAIAENMTPKQICDKYFEIHNSIYRWFGIGFDYFGRTTTSEQTEIVQKLFKDLDSAGFIESQSVEQLLCQKCDRYLADRFVEGTCPHPGCGYEDARGDQCDKCGKLVNATSLIRPRCKLCNSAPILRDSRQLFINLPKVEPKLKAWVESTDNGWTNNAKVITRAWLKEGLRSRCITRDLKWGIPVPKEGFESKVFYVWFDAPIGYMSITKRYTKDWLQWWQPKDPKVEVDLYQFMAKDNVPFHSVLFPSTLLGINQGYTTVKHIMATEYLNYEDGKFSKSRGIGVFGNDAMDTGIPADVWRFYLASARPEGQDSSFSWMDLMTRNNSELLNNLGNFINRAMVFCEKNFASTIPEINLMEPDVMLLALVNREIKGYAASMEKARMRDGIRHILSISRHGNQYMQSQQPWVLLKGTEEEKKQAATTIALSVNLSYLLGILLSPFMPETSRNIFQQLNVQKNYLDASNTNMKLLLKAGHKIGKPVPLFDKIEPTTIDELKSKYGGVQGTGATTAAVPPTPTTPKVFFETVAQAEKALSDQAAKVRELKASAEKAVWQPEVEILLDYKKQVENLKNKKMPEQVNEEDLEALVANQGEKVRKMKSGGVEKAIWQPEVNILLELKKKLALAKGEPEQPPQQQKPKKKK